MLKLFTFEPFHLHAKIFLLLAFLRMKLLASKHNVETRRETKCDVTWWNHCQLHSCFIVTQVCSRVWDGNSANVKWFIYQWTVLSVWIRNVFLVPIHISRKNVNSVSIRLSAPRHFTHHIVRTRQKDWLLLLNCCMFYCWKWREVLINIKVHILLFSLNGFYFSALGFHDVRVILNPSLAENHEANWSEMYFNRQVTDSFLKVLTCSDVTAQNKDEQAAVDVHPHLHTEMIQFPEWSPSSAYVSAGTGTVWLLTGVVRNFSVYSWLMNTHLLMFKDEITHPSTTTYTLLVVEIFRL